MINKTRQNISNTDAPINTDQLKVTIELSQNVIYKHLGKIDFIDNRVDQSTGTLAIRAIFPNPEALLLPGQYTNISITLPNAQNAILIPQSAVQEEQQGRFVLVVNDKNTVEKRMVTLGARHEARWIVEGGIAVGDKVIVEGLQKVRMGLAVTTTEQTEIPFTSSAE